MELDKHRRENTICQHKEMPQTQENTHFNRLEVIALYISQHSWGFFLKSHNICCSVDEYCAFDGAECLPGMKKAEESQLLGIMSNIKISEPIPLHWGVSESCFLRASVSHKGVLAYKCYRDERMVIYFKNLINDKEALIDCEKDCQIGFYDEKAIAIIRGEPLQEASIESIYQCQTLNIFCPLTEEMGITPYSDVSLMHETRILYFTTESDDAYMYHVDIKKCKRLNPDVSVYSFASITGLKWDGVSFIFQESGSNNGTLLMKETEEINSITEMYPNNSLAYVIPSTASPNDISLSLLLFDNGMVCNGHNETSSINKFMEYFPFYSLVRIYKDIFIMYDKSIHDWTLVRICVE